MNNYLAFNFEKLYFYTFLIHQKLPKMTILPKKKISQSKEVRIVNSAQAASASSSSIVSDVNHLLGSVDDKGTSQVTVSAPPHRKRTNPCGSSTGPTRSKSRHNSSAMPKAIVAPQNIVPKV